jgi:hypothetical protein
MVRQLKTSGKVEEINIAGVFDIAKVTQSYNEYLESSHYFPPS